MVFESVRKHPVLTGILAFAAAVLPWLAQVWPLFSDQPPSKSIHSGWAIVVQPTVWPLLVTTLVSLVGFGMLGFIIYLQRQNRAPDITLVPNATELVVVEAEPQKPISAEHTLVTQTLVSHPARVAGLAPEGVTPEYLMNLYEGRAEILADKLLKPHLGSRLLVSGAVRSITPCPDHCCHATIEQNGRWMILQFDEAHWQDRVAAHPLGSTLRAIGEIYSANRACLTLDHCELIERAASASSEAMATPGAAPLGPASKKGDVD